VGFLKPVTKAFQMIQRYDVLCEGHKAEDVLYILDRVCFSITKTSGTLEHAWAKLKGKIAAVTSSKGTS
jgi:hypothetical protein